MEFEKEWKRKWTKESTCYNSVDGKKREGGNEGIRIGERGEIIYIKPYGL